MPKNEGFKLRWSKKENDWLFEYNNNAGKSLMTLFFDMLKVEKNIDWLKQKFISFSVPPKKSDLKKVGWVEIPENERKNLKQILTDAGFDYTTLTITCKKLSE